MPRTDRRSGTLVLSALVVCASVTRAEAGQIKDEEWPSYNRDVAGTRRSVIALDAATGELLWVHGEHEGARGAAAPRQLSGRGLAYWSDGKEERILYVTPGYRLICLDAKTGSPMPSFGEDGAVDLKLEDDQAFLPDI